MFTHTLTFDQFHPWFKYCTGHKSYAAMFTHTHLWAVPSPRAIRWLRRGLRGSCRTCRPSSRCGAPRWRSNTHRQECSSHQGTWWWPSGWAPLHRPARTGTPITYPSCLWRRKALIKNMIGKLRPRRGKGAPLEYAYDQAQKIYSRFPFISPPLKVFTSYKKRKSDGPNPSCPLKVR